MSRGGEWWRVVEGLGRSDVIRVWRRKRRYYGPFNPSQRAVWLASSCWRSFNPDWDQPGLDRGVGRACRHGHYGPGSAARFSARSRKGCLPGVEGYPRNLSDGMLPTATLRRVRRRRAPPSTRLLRVARAHRVGEKLITDRWIRQTNFDVGIIYGIGVGRGRRRRRRFDEISRCVLRRRESWHKERCLSGGCRCNFYANFLPRESNTPVKIRSFIRGLTELFASYFKVSLTLRWSGVIRRHFLVVSFFLISWGSYLLLVLYVL